MGSKRKHIETKQQLIASFAAWNGSTKSDKSSSFNFYTSFLAEKKRTGQYSAMKLAAQNRHELLLLAEDWGAPRDKAGLDQWVQDKLKAKELEEALDKEMMDRINRED